MYWLNPLICNIMYYLLLDIETTGLKKDNEYPNIVQIGFLLATYNESKSSFFVLQHDSLVGHTEIIKYNYIIKPENFEIPFESTLIHGITNKYAIENGKPISYVISLLNKYIREYQPILIAHNAEFDIDILKYHGLVKYVSYFCTMKFLSEIRFKGNDKYLKLTELYQLLFNKSIIQTHDALKDVEILFECLNELFIHDEIVERLRKLFEMAGKQPPTQKVLNESKILNISNKNSFDDFFKTFNKLKILKSNIEIENKFYGFRGLNGITKDKYNGDVFDECTYVSINSQNNNFILSLISSKNEEKFKYPLHAYRDYEMYLNSRLNAQDCLSIIYGDLKELNYDKRVFKDVMSINYRLLINNSFFIGKEHNINGEDLTYYVEPTWINLWENDIVGFVDDNSIVMLIKNNSNKFEFFISEKMFKHVKEEYKNDWNGNEETDEYISIKDFYESSSNILKYFKQLQKNN